MDDGRFFGNLDEVPGELLQKVNEACEKNIVHVPMQPGDVLLIDNYKCLHGRDIFVGDRLHAVATLGFEYFQYTDSSVHLVSGSSLTKTRAHTSAEFAMESTMDLIERLRSEQQRRTCCQAGLFLRQIVGYLIMGSSARRTLSSGYYQ